MNKPAMIAAASAMVEQLLHGAQSNRAIAATTMSNELLACLKDPRGFRRHLRVKTAREVATFIEPKLTVREERRADAAITDHIATVWVFSEDEIRCLLARACATAIEHIHATPR